MNRGEIDDAASVVVILTGSGLKTTETIGEMMAQSSAATT
jgi:threonine synthase